MNSSSMIDQRQAAQAQLVQAIGVINTIILAKQEQVQLACACLLAGGHLLIDDVPGTGKTVMANTLAKVFGLASKRVQFTNDLLPADILGASIFDPQTQSFSLQKGPIFTQLLLADEINRATAKTQSALLEAMEEKQVTIEGETHRLDAEFFVVATQNPLDQVGTYALPEAQLDRFLMRISLGYLDRASEMALLAGEDRRVMLETQAACVDISQLMAWQQLAQSISCEPLVLQYLYDLLAYSRDCGDFVNGLSTRAGLALLKAAKAYAFIQGDAYLLPAHIQAVFVAVCGHRLVFKRQQDSANLAGEQVLNAVAIALVQ